MLSLTALAMLSACEIGGTKHVANAVSDPEGVAYLYGSRANDFNDLTQAGVEKMQYWANAGDALAVARLSNYYYLAKQDGDHGAFWQEKAARLGEPTCQWGLAQRLWSTHGEAVRAEVVDLLQHSSAGGVREAKELLDRIQSEAKAGR